MLYYMLAGQYPFPDGSAAEKMMAHQLKKPQPLAELAPDTPAELIAIVDKLMQKKPEQRYTSIADVVEALRPMVRKASGAHARPALKGAASSSRPAPKLESTPTPPAPKSVGPSAPTPRPQTVGSLPTRSSMRGGAAPAPKPAPPQPAQPKAPAADTAAPDAIPGGFTADAPPSFWDGSLGPVGVFATAIIACAIGYLAFKMFN
jgi:serine/threonine-protein kinase